MAHRKCVIVSDIPENLEVIGGGALTFRAGDADDLAKVIGRVDKDADLAAEFGRRALARVKAEYDWQNIVTRLEEVYHG
jgi:glycosyltransferase involved in cell wall biosynthesis